MADIFGSETEFYTYPEEMGNGDPNYSVSIAIDKASTEYTKSLRDDEKISEILNNPDGIAKLDLNKTVDGEEPLHLENTLLDTNGLHLLSARAAYYPLMYESNPNIKEDLVTEQEARYIMYQHEGKLTPKHGRRNRIIEGVGEEEEGDLNLFQEITSLEDRLKDTDLEFINELTEGFLLNDHIFFDTALNFHNLVYKDIEASKLKVINKSVVDKGSTTTFRVGKSIVKNIGRAVADELLKLAKGGILTEWLRAMTIYAVMKLIDMWVHKTIPLYNVQKGIEEEYIHSHFLFARIFSTDWMRNIVSKEWSESSSKKFTWYLKGELSTLTDDVLFASGQIQADIDLNTLHYRDKYLTDIFGSGGGKVSEVFTKYHNKLLSSKQFDPSTDTGMYVGIRQRNGEANSVLADVFTLGIYKPFKDSGDGEIGHSAVHHLYDIHFDTTTQLHFYNSIYDPRYYRYPFKHNLLEHKSVLREFELSYLLRDDLVVSHDDSYKELHQLDYMSNVISNTDGIFTALGVKNEQFKTRKLGGFASKMTGEFIDDIADELGCSKLDAYNRILRSDPTCIDNDKFISLRTILNGAPLRTYNIEKLMYEVTSVEYVYAIDNSALRIKPSGVTFHLGGGQRDLTSVDENSIAKIQKYFIQNRTDDFIQCLDGIIEMIKKERPDIQKEEYHALARLKLLIGYSQRIVKLPRLDQLFVAKEDDEFTVNQILRELNKHMSGDCINELYYEEGNPVIGWLKNRLLPHIPIIGDFIDIVTSGADAVEKVAKYEKNHYSILEYVSGLIGNLRHFKHTNIRNLLGTYRKRLDVIGDKGHGIPSQFTNAGAGIFALERLVRSTDKNGRFDPLNNDYDDYGEILGLYYETWKDTKEVLDNMKNFGFLGLIAADVVESVIPNTIRKEGNRKLRQQKEQFVEDNQILDWEIKGDWVFDRLERAYFYSEFWDHRLRSRTTNQKNQRRPANCLHVRDVVLYSKGQMAGIVADNWCFHVLKRAVHPNLNIYGIVKGHLAAFKQTYPVDRRLGNYFWLKNFMLYELVNDFGFKLSDFVRPSFGARVESHSPGVYLKSVARYRFRRFISNMAHDSNTGEKKSLHRSHEVYLEECFPSTHHAVELADNPVLEKEKSLFGFTSFSQAITPQHRGNLMEYLSFYFVSMVDTDFVYKFPKLLNNVFTKFIKLYESRPELLLLDDKRNFVKKLLAYAPKKLQYEFLEKVLEKHKYYEKCLDAIPLKQLIGFLSLYPFHLFSSSGYFVTRYKRTVQTQTNMKWPLLFGSEYVMPDEGNYRALWMFLLNLEGFDEDLTDARIDEVLNPATGNSLDISTGYRSIDRYFNLVDADASVDGAHIPLGRVLKRLVLYASQYYSIRSINGKVVEIPWRTENWLYKQSKIRSIFSFSLGTHTYYRKLNDPNSIPKGATIFDTKNFVWKYRSESASYLEQNAYIHSLCSYDTYKRQVAIGDDLYEKHEILEDAETMFEPRFLVNFYNDTNKDGFFDNWQLKKYDFVGYVYNKNGFRDDYITKVDEDGWADYVYELSGEPYFVQFGKMVFDQLTQLDEDEDADGLVFLDTNTMYRNLSLEYWLILKHVLRPVSEISKLRNIRCVGKDGLFSIEDHHGKQKIENIYKPHNLTATNLLYDIKYFHQQILPFVQGEFFYGSMVSLVGNPRITTAFTDLDTSNRYYQGKENVAFPLRGKVFIGPYADLSGVDLRRVVIGDPNWWSLDPSPIPHSVDSDYLFNWRYSNLEGSTLWNGKFFVEQFEGCRLRGVDMSGRLLMDDFMYDRPDNQGKATYRYKQGVVFAQKIKKQPVDTMPRLWVETQIDGTFQYRAEGTDTNYFTFIQSPPEILDNYWLCQYLQDRDSFLLFNHLRLNKEAFWTMFAECTPRDQKTLVDCILKNNQENLLTGNWSLVRLDLQKVLREILYNKTDKYESDDSTFLLYYKQYVLQRLYSSGSEATKYYLLTHDHKYFQLTPEDQDLCLKENQITVSDNLHHYDQEKTKEQKIQKMIQLYDSDGWMIGRNLRADPNRVFKNEYSRQRNNFISSLKKIPRLIFYSDTENPYYWCFRKNPGETAYTEQMYDGFGGFRQYDDLPDYRDYEHPTIQSMRKNFPRNPYLLPSSFTTKDRTLSDFDRDRHLLSRNLLFNKEFSNQATFDATLTILSKTEHKGNNSVGKWDVIQDFTTPGGVTRKNSKLLSWGESHFSGQANGIVFESPSVAALRGELNLSDFGTYVAIVTEEYLSFAYLSSSFRGLFLCTRDADGTAIRSSELSVNAHESVRIMDMGDYKWEAYIADKAGVRCYVIDCATPYYNFWWTQKTFTDQQTNQSLTTYTEAFLTPPLMMDIFGLSDQDERLMCVLYGNDTLQLIRFHHKRTSVHVIKYQLKTDIAVASFTVSCVRGNQWYVCVHFQDGTIECHQVEVTVEPKLALVVRKTFPRSIEETTLATSVWQEAKMHKYKPLLFLLSADRDLLVYDLERCTVSVKLTVPCAEVHQMSLTSVDTMKVYFLTDVGIQYIQTGTDFIPTLTYLAPFLDAKQLFQCVDFLHNNNQNWLGFYERWIQRWAVDQQFLDNIQTTEIENLLDTRILRTVVKIVQFYDEYVESGAVGRYYLPDSEGGNVLTALAQKARNDLDAGEDYLTISNKFLPHFTHYLANATNEEVFQVHKILFSEGGSYKNILSATLYWHGISTAPYIIQNMPYGEFVARVVHEYDKENFTLYQLRDHLRQMRNSWWGEVEGTWRSKAIQNALRINTNLSALLCRDLREVFALGYIYQLNEKLVQNSVLQLPSCVPCYDVPTNQDLAILLSLDTERLVDGVWEESYLADITLEEGASLSNQEHGLGLVLATGSTVTYVDTGLGVCYLRLDESAPLRDREVAAIPDSYSVFPEYLYGSPVPKYTIPLTQDISLLLPEIDDPSNVSLDDGFSIVAGGDGTLYLSRDLTHLTTTFVAYGCDVWHFTIVPTAPVKITGSLPDSYQTYPNYYRQMLRYNLSSNVIKTLRKKITFPPHLELLKDMYSTKPISELRHNEVELREYYTYFTVSELLQDDLSLVSILTKEETMQIVKDEIQGLLRSRRFDRIKQILDDQQMRTDLINALLEYMYTSMFQSDYTEMIRALHDRGLLDKFEIKHLLQYGMPIRLFFSFVLPKYPEWLETAKNELRNFDLTNYLSSTSWQKDAAVKNLVESNWTFEEIFDKSIKLTESSVNFWVENKFVGKSTLFSVTLEELGTELDFSENRNLVERFMDLGDEVVTVEQMIHLGASYADLKSRGFDVENFNYSPEYILGVLETESNLTLLRDNTKFLGAESICSLDCLGEKEFPLSKANVLTYGFPLQQFERLADVPGLERGRFYDDKRLLSTTTVPRPNNFLYQTLPVINGEWDREREVYNVNGYELWSNFRYLRAGVEFSRKFASHTRSFQLAVNDTMISWAQNRPSKPSRRSYTYVGNHNHDILQDKLNRHNGQVLGNFFTNGHVDMISAHSTPSNLVATVIKNGAFVFLWDGTEPFNSEAGIFEVPINLDETYGIHIENHEHLAGYNSTTQVIVPELVCVDIYLSKDDVLDVVYRLKVNYVNTSNDEIKYVYEDDMYLQRFQCTVDNKLVQFSQNSVERILNLPSDEHLHRLTTHYSGTTRTVYAQTTSSKVYSLDGNPFLGVVSVDIDEATQRLCLLKKVSSTFHLTVQEQDGSEVVEVHVPERLRFDNEVAEVHFTWPFACVMFLQDTMVPYKMFIYDFNTEKQYVLHLETFGTFKGEVLLESNGSLYLVREGVRNNTKAVFSTHVDLQNHLVTHTQTGEIKSATIINPDYLYLPDFENYVLNSAGVTRGGLFQIIDDGIGGKTFRLLSESETNLSITSTNPLEVIIPMTHTDSFACLLVEQRNGTLSVLHFGEPNCSTNLRKSSKENLDIFSDKDLSQMSLISTRDVSSAPTVAYMMQTTSDLIVVYVQRTYDIDYYIWKEVKRKTLSKALLNVTSTKLVAGHVSQTKTGDITLVLKEGTNYILVFYIATVITTALVAETDFDETHLVVLHDAVLYVTGSNTLHVHRGSNPTGQTQTLPTEPKVLVAGKEQMVFMLSTNPGALIEYNLRGSSLVLGNRSLTGIPQLKDIATFPTGEVVGYEVNDGQDLVTVTTSLPAQSRPEPTGTTATQLVVSSNGKFICVALQDDLEVWEFDGEQYVLRYDYDGLQETFVQMDVSEEEGGILCRSEGSKVELHRNFQTGPTIIQSRNLPSTYVHRVVLTSGSVVYALDINGNLYKMDFSQVNNIIVTPETTNVDALFACPLRVTLLLYKANKLFFLEDMVTPLYEFGEGTTVLHATMDRSRNRVFVVTASTEQELVLTVLTRNKSLLVQTIELSVNVDKIWTNSFGNFVVVAHGTTHVVYTQDLRTANGDWVVYHELVADHAVTLSATIGDVLVSKQESGLRFVTTGLDHVGKYIDFVETGLSGTDAISVLHKDFYVPLHYLRQVYSMEQLQEALGQQVTEELCAQLPALYSLDLDEQGALVLPFSE